MRPRNPGATALTSDLTADTPAAGARDRHVSVRCVPCPTCAVPAGFPCVTANGNSVQHKSRRRMALRAETTTYVFTDVQAAQRVTAYTRKALRERSGLSRRALAVALSISENALSRWEQGKSVPSGPDGATYGRWLTERLAAQG